MPKKILIVEDEANIRELLRLYLEREGYTVLEAENGVEGIKKWKSDKPDMLLLDVMMPVMDGWAVCREIRAESDVPIIMLTAKGETADRVSGLEMGADDYIVKPLEMPEVIARVRAVFRRMAPVHELSMMMSIALRFIPTLIEETEKIISAQKARGADFDSGNLIQRAKAMIPILVPLFISAFRRADELATAMECRLYRGDVGRTRMRQLKIARVDICALLWVAALFVVIIALKHFGL